jgi:D-alanyl-D-alanine carboxypeptidase
MRILRIEAAAFLLAALMLAGGAAGAAPAGDNPPRVSAEAAVLADLDSGAVIYALNESKRMLIASTTKIMTALVALERCGLRDEVEIKREWTLTEGSSMHLRAGERRTVEELLYGLLLVSGNDAARALACHCAGGEEAFAALMNARARELGMADTSFSNPHGLDQEGHYSTASDMAKLARAAMKNPELARMRRQGRPAGARPQKPQQALELRGRARA